MKNREMERNEEIEIDIVKIGKALYQNVLQIVVSSAVGMAAAFLLALLLTPKYQSAAMFYVKNSAQASHDSISSADIVASKELVESYIVILQSEETLEAVIWYAGTDKTCEEVLEMISASAVNSTEFFKVTVTSTDPQEAERIANAIVYILPERIARIMEGTSVKIVDTAVADSEPSSPDYVKMTLFGFLIGFFLSVGWIVLQAVLDETIRSKRDIAKCCTYPILAVISEKEPYTAESYKLLRAKLRFSFSDDEKERVIGITSAGKGEGKSLTAANLAWSLRQRGKKVLLIDCDLHRSQLAARQNLKEAPGLAEFLTGKCSMKQIVQCCSAEGKEPRFPVITAGGAIENGTALLTSDRLRVLLKAVRKNCDYVILDLPPVEEAGDLLELAKQTDGILLLVRRDHCDAGALQNALEQLEFVNARILGVVFNCTEGERKAEAAQ